MNMKVIFEYDLGVMVQFLFSFELLFIQFYCVEVVNGWIEVRDVFDMLKDVGVMIWGEIDGNLLIEMFDLVDYYEKEVFYFVCCFDQGMMFWMDLMCVIQNMELVDVIC